VISKQDFPTINERAPQGIKADGTPYKVLLVDDSVFVTKQISQILGSEGYEIVGTAGDGFEGVQKYKELCPNVDLVTMDITMPKMDGITALEQIMEFDKNARDVYESLHKTLLYTNEPQDFRQAIDIFDQISRVFADLGE